MTGARRVGVSLAGAATLIAALTVLSRVVGLGRWVVFSGAVGSTCTGTAYSTANLLPNVLFEVVAGGALAASVVPLLSAPLVRHDRAEADRTASALLTWAVLVLAPLSLLLALLAGPLVAAFPPRGGCAGVVSVAARMLVVFAPQVLLYGIGVVLSGVLQAHRRFAGPAVAPLLSSLVVVGAYLVFGSLASGRQRASGWLPGRGAELVLSVGTTLGVLALSLPLLVPVARAGVRLRPTLRFAPGVARRARGLAMAGVLGLLAQQCLVVVTAQLANRVGGTGTLNVYQYVQAVYLLPYAVLAVPLATAAFPQLAERAAAADAAGYARTLAGSTRLVVLTAAAGAAVLAAVAPAVEAFFTAVDASRGVGAGGSALAGLGASLTAFAPGLVGFALIAHLGRALFAAGRPRWAAGATVAGWATAAVVSVVLVLLLSGGARDPGATLLGLGAGSSIGMSLAGGLLLLGASRGPLGGTAPVAVLAGVPRALLVAAGVGAVATLVGRLVTTQVLSGGLLHSLGAGVLGSVVTVVVLVAGLAVTDSGDLRALVGRVAGPTRARRGGAGGG